MKTSANDWATRQRIERERAAWVAKHGPACQICGTVPKTRGLQWDHDHKTGAHRGWLCWKCNKALPTWVTPEWLLNTYLYLREGNERYNSPNLARPETLADLTQRLVSRP